MVATTMNGWSLTNVPLTTITAGGHSTPIRSGEVATVLGHVARRFHAEVEPIVTFSGWRSVATNAAVGGHPRSNHPSGTAIDCNGFKHPYRAPVNFAAAQVAAIRRILAEVAPVVRWGGDFGAALRDGMHFEIVGGAAQVAAIAARLPTQPAPAQEDDMDANDKRILNEANQNAFHAWETALGALAEQRLDAVAGYYRDLLGREGSPSEIAAHVASIDTVHPLELVRWEIATSDEAKARRVPAGVTPSGAPIDYAALAKAVNDDAARRLAS